VRTTLELPDPLFARLKARASSERVTLKQLLHSYVEKGLSTEQPVGTLPRLAGTLPQLKGALFMDAALLSNAALVHLLDA
jgi:hypothetical protein